MRNASAGQLVPAVCDVSVANACNAACDFCSYVREKGIVRDHRWLDVEKFAEALPILYRRGIRYVNFQGGEPLLHPAIDRLVADARAIGTRPLSADTACRAIGLHHQLNRLLRESSACKKRRTAGSDSRPMARW